MHVADGRKFGLLPSPPDRRDFPARAFLPAQIGELPAEYRLPFTAPIMDQGSTSMCVDFSLRALKEIQEQVERGTREPYANGYIYGNRQPADWQGEGMYSHEALNALVRHGIPPASVLNVTGTYEECRAAYLANKEAADQAAAPQRALSYVLCATPEEAMASIYHLRSPLAMSMTVTRRFAYFIGIGTGPGVVAMEPPENFQEGAVSYLGGHMMHVIGWRQLGDRPHWIVQNSWSKGWGDGGLCYMPFDYPGIDYLYAVTDARPRGPRVRLEIGSQTLTMDNDAGTVETKAMDVAPFIQDGRTFVPLRFVTDALAQLLGRKIGILPVIDAAGRVTGVELVAFDEGA